MTKLSEHLAQWRAERPDEWRMDEFIREAKKLEVSIETQMQWKKENNTELERLTECLKKANEQAEHFERLCQCQRRIL